MIFKKNRSFITILALTVCMLLSGCFASVPRQQTPEKPAEPVSTQAVNETSEEVEIPELSLTRTPGKAPGDKKDVKKSEKEQKEEKKDPQREDITEDGAYCDLESVVLYYDRFGKLPSNYITKKEAQGLGWEGGALNPYKKGASIGGDHFGNYEKQLPDEKGVKYIECDIDTNGGKRGAKRLIISNNGKYYYTSDHYESFSEVKIDDGRVEILK